MMQSQKKLEGTLWKWTNYWNGWQPRWFTLDKGMLSYYKSQEEVSLGCKGSINIAAAVVTAHPSDPYRLDVVVPGEQHFYLKAGSPHERQQWLVALGSVKSSVNSEKASKALDEAGRLTQKQCELRLYCDLLMQQIHSVKCLVVDHAVPDIKKLDDCSALLSETCDTFINTLEECVRLSSPNSPSILTGLSNMQQNVNGTSDFPNLHNTISRQHSPTHNNSTSKSNNGKDTPNRSFLPNIPTFFTNLNSSFANFKISGDESINSMQFLECSTDLAKIFDLLNANAFQPIKMDMISNIRKLYQKHESLREIDDNNTFDTAQRMIESEIKNNSTSNPNSATKALLELKRVIWFLREFLQMFIDSYHQQISAADDHQILLSDIVNEAYAKTLKLNHTWILRGVFTLAAKETVSRDEFYKALLNNCAEMAGGGHSDPAPNNTGGASYSASDANKNNFLKLKSDLIDYVAGLDRALKSLNQFYAKYKIDEI